MPGLFEYAKRDALTDPKKQDHTSGLFTKSEQNPGLGIFDAFETTGPFSDVDINVYRDSIEPQKFNADAITKGNSVFLSSGSGELIRHEMGHVLQQKEGMVTSGEAVAGELVNKDEVLERKADILGSQIPQEAVDKAMAGSRTGMSLYGTQGIVQCGKTKKEQQKKEDEPQKSNLEELKRQLKVGVEIANRNYNAAGTRPKDVPEVNNKGIAWPIMQETEILSPEDVESQIMKGGELIDSLVPRVGRGQLVPMRPDLQSHIYRATVIDKSKSATSVTGATGLHAYSDYFDKNNFRAAGGLPGYIQPLGFIGDRTQIHILHWKNVITKDEKISTMLPNNMPEGVSKMLFEVARAQSPIGSVREFGGFDFESKGDTLYPAGNNVTFDISPQELAGKGTGSKKESKQKKKQGQGKRAYAQAEEQVTLNDISKMLSTLSGAALIERLALLESEGLYHPFESLKKG